MTALLLFTGHPVAHGTTADTIQEISRFEGLWCLCNEHLPDSGEPEAVFVSKIVTGTTTMAFKERIVAEGPETGAGRGERLATAATTCTSMLTREADKIIK